MAPLCPTAHFRGASAPALRRASFRSRAWAGRRRPSPLLLLMKGAESQRAATPPAPLMVKDRTCAVRTCTRRASRRVGASHGVYCGTCASVPERNAVELANKKRYKIRSLSDSETYKDSARCSAAPRRSAIRPPGPRPRATVECRVVVVAVAICQRRSLRWSGP
jgi:ferredoxin